jgi:hypothetical protein
MVPARLRELERHPALKGISIGARCRNGGDWIGNETGHAHEDPHDHWHGWICLSSLRHLNRTNVAHELAHVIRGNQRHDEAWRRVVRRDLKGRVERRYQRRA